MKKRQLWSVSPYPSNELFAKSKKWSVQIRPLPEETLYSWMLLLTRANFANYYKTFRKIPKIYINELSSHLLNLLKEKTNIEDEEIKKFLFPDNLKKFILNKIRFCPLCLKEDKIQFLRRKWKYRFVNACPIHRCLLIDRCSKCKSKIIPHRLKWNESLYICYNCKANMALTKIKMISRNHSALKANNFFFSLLNFIEKNSDNTWNYC